jgi:hypothetical protein
LFIGVVIPIAALSFLRHGKQAAALQIFNLRFACKSVYLIPARPLPIPFPSLP